MVRDKDGDPSDENVFDRELLGRGYDEDEIRRFASDLRRTISEVMSVPRDPHSIEEFEAAMATKH